MRGIGAEEWKYVENLAKYERNTPYNEVTNKNIGQPKIY